MLPVRTPSNVIHVTFTAGGNDDGKKGFRIMFNSSHEGKNEIKLMLCTAVNVYNYAG